jgi:energy-converting hydrogenase Eha subunit G
MSTLHAKKNFIYSIYLVIALAIIGVGLILLTNVFFKKGDISDSDLEFQQVI